MGADDRKERDGKRREGGEGWQVSSGWKKLFAEAVTIDG